MENFIKELQTNPEFKSAFAAYMHKEEARISESFKVIYDNLNKQVMASVKAFAEEKGMTLQYNEEAEKKCADQCKAMAAQMNKAIIEQFAKNF
jgi:uncharacterized protein with ParB-like and HNH nuclease domain